MTALDPDERKLANDATIVNATGSVGVVNALLERRNGVTSTTPAQIILPRATSTSVAMTHSEMLVSLDGCTRLLCQRHSY
jgi:hypothetical protein